MVPEPASPEAPTLNRTRQLELYRRALKTLPGGTDSMVSAMRRMMVAGSLSSWGRQWRTTCIS